MKENLFFVPSVTAETTPTRAEAAAGRAKGDPVFGSTAGFTTVLLVEASLIGIPVEVEADATAFEPAAVAEAAAAAFPAAAAAALDADAPLVPV